MQKAYSIELGSHGNKANSERIKEVYNCLRSAAEEMDYFSRLVQEQYPASTIERELLVALNGRKLTQLQYAAEKRKLNGQTAYLSE